MKKFMDWLQLSGFRSHRADFYRDLAEMYERSEPQVAFLEGEIANSLRVRDRSRVSALKLMLAKLQSGERLGQLSHVLGSVMPRSDQMMLASVERADDKAEALRALAVAVEQQQSMTKMMISYSVLPLVMLPVCIVLIMVLSGVILAIDKATPEFVRPELWAGFNGFCRDLAVLSTDWGGLILAGLTGAMVALVWSLSRWTGRLRSKADGLPIYSLYRDFQSGLMFSSLAMLLKSGSPLKSSIEDLAERSSGWGRWQLLRVLAALEDRPNAVIEAFSHGILSPHMLARAYTLHRSAATFSDVLVALGTKEAANVQKRVKDSAIFANIAIVSSLVCVATFMGLASITVPGKFATLMEPSTLMALKQKQALAGQAP